MDTSAQPGLASAGDAPGTPLWRERPDWVSGRIEGGARPNLRSVWVMAAFWNAVSTPLLWLLPRAIERRPIAALGYLFPVVGVGLLVWAGRLTARARRFGRARIELASVPVVPGGTLAGVIYVERGAATMRRLADGLPASATLRLTCLSRTLDRDDGAAREDIVWREEAEAPLRVDASDADGFQVPVHFAIPADAQPTTTVGQRAGIVWALTIEATLAGADLRDDFDIPMASAAEAPAVTPRFAAKPVATPAHRRVPITPEALARRGIHVRAVRNGVEYHFEPARNVGVAAGTTAFLGVWSGALWLQWALGFPWLFPIVTGLVELLLLYVVLELWFGATTVSIAEGMLRRRHTLFGLGGRETIARADVATIDLCVSMSTAGRYGTPYYELRATLRNGRRRTLGSGIADKRQAEWLANQMRSALQG